MAANTKLHIPEYALLEVIASGGFGLVWRAVHVASQEVVAIKVLHPELIGSHDIILRFQREAEAIAQLHHPNVVELYECGTLPDGRPYLVMEYLTGRDLASHLESHGPMTPADITNVLRALASALTAAHELGIVHRDLKASNVVLSEYDGGLRVVLLDFGIAKLLEQNGEPITAVRQAVGSAVCISPEQIRGEGVDPRTDVYGLGSLAFHMLTGSPPFDGDWISAMNAHLFAERPRPSDRIDISVTFDDVVVRAMSRDPGHRHAGARAFYDAWCAALEDSMPASDSRRMRLPSRRVIGCYVDVHADPAALEDPDDALLDDMASIFPLAASYLERHGFVLAFESGDSMLFVMPCSDHDQDTRAAVVNQAIQLLPDLYLRPTRHADVYVNLFLHVGDAEMAERAVSGGTILDVTSWVVPYDGCAVLVSDALGRHLELGDYAQRVSDNVISVYRLKEPKTPGR